MTVHTRRLPTSDRAPHPLGRHVEHDDASRRFSYEARAERRAIVPRRWERISPIFDQGSLGSCTGMAMAGWLGSQPHCGDANMFRENEATWLYAAATRLDAFGGEWPPSDTGSSGVGVAKAARMMGMIRSWSTAFTTDGLLQGLMVGPVLIGSIWTDGMFDTDGNGEVRPTGGVAGGHEYLCYGWDGTYLLCNNSWGVGYGVSGSFKMTLATWEILRNQEADVVIPHV